MKVFFSVAVALLLTGGSMLFAEELSGQIMLDSVYGSAMVLQRDRVIRITGTADPGRTVKVALGEHSVIARADAAGNWCAELPPFQAGGPYVLTAACRDRVITLNDILIGEVWLCSGQSNMEMELRNCENAAAEIAAADDPEIRLFSVRRNASCGVVAAKVRSDGWMPCTPESVADFSAIGYFFARELRRELKVPVGIIDSSWGGTPIEAWLSAAAFAAHGEKVLAEMAAERREERSDAVVEQKNSSEFSRWIARLDVDYAAEIAAAAHWREKTVPDIAAWKRYQVPGTFSANGISGNGVVWLRRSVLIPDAWRGEELVLSLGPVDDCDETYFNGHLIGSVGADVPTYWAQKRVYRIRPEWIDSGDNTIAVRVIDHAFNGGLDGNPDEIYIGPVNRPGERMSLTGHQWLSRVEFILDSGKTPPRPAPAFVNDNSQLRPAAVYNGMIAPLTGFPIQGVLWYQGETNVGEARLYDKFFPMLITSWRAAWREPAMPFVFAQLAAYFRHTPGNPPEPELLLNRRDSDWAELRESQARALKLPFTGMAVCIDVGDPADIHPPRKLPVALRMEQEALRIAYGRKAVSSGPVYAGMTREGDSVRIRFDNTGQGLRAEGGELGEFEVAGEDRVFHRASARIDGTTVVAHSPLVAIPMFVRYAWANYPVAPNLFNREGFPAVPFRTDSAR